MVIVNYGGIMRYRIYTDGSYEKEKDIGGWSMVIADHHGLKLKSGIKRGTTNNQMELVAVLKALEYAVRKRLVNIEIVTDSMYVLNGIQKYAEVWKQNNWVGLSGELIKYRSEWEGILIMLGSLKENNFTVKFSKVKSHNGNSLNELADAKAREAIKAYKEK